jgi:Ala-tRNA(Pro) deacylase
MTVLDLLQSCHVEHEVFNHPPAYSAQRRAKILHTRGHCVVKCLLMTGPFGRFLALLPADRRVHFPTLSRELGGKVTLARPEELEPLFLECEGGVVPPFGRPFGLGMVLDDSILSTETIVVEGRHHMEAIRLKCSDLERMELPRRVAFSQPWPMIKAS